MNRLLFIAPRGFAKSSICSVSFPLWLSLYGKRKDVFLVSATISLAREMLRKIRAELKNNVKILEDFGDLISPDKDTEEFILLKNGVSLRAKGRGFQIRGFRPDQIICDDLEDEEIIYSKEQRDKLEQWFFRTLLPTLKPDQNLVYVGTKIHRFSLMAKLEKKPEFVSKFYRALEGDASIWPEMWPPETLKSLRREMGEYAFQAEYQNNPISLEDQPIKPHFLEGVRVEGKPDALCLAVDPAISEKTSSDERAFVLFGRFENGFREIFSEKGRWPVTEQIEKIIGIWERYSKTYENVPFSVVVESVAFQKVFKDDLLKESRRRKLYIPVSEAELGIGNTKRPKDKFTRLMQVVHLFEQKLVDVRNPDLREELLAFPIGDADNMVDAAVFSLYWLMKFRPGGFLAKKEKRNLPAEVGARPSYYVKEVRPGVYVSSPEPPEAKRRGSVKAYGR